MIHAQAALPPRCDDVNASRRRLLTGAAVSMALPAVCRAQAAGTASAATPPPLGWLRPRELAPDVLLTDAQGHSQPLRARLMGRTTAVQLMFTGCTTTCTTQGALFSLMAERLDGTSAPAWLSISIDALGDDAARLARWQQRLGANPRWCAAVPAVREVDGLAAFLRGGLPSSGTHTNQVFVFDRQARLAYRTGDDPPPPFLQALLSTVG
jgi:protein SCO1